MVQNILWKADCHSAYQKISCFLYGTRRFIITVFTKARHWTLSWASWIQPCQRISPGPRHFETFRNKLLFYGEDILAPRPNLQAGGPPLVGFSRLLIQHIRSYPPYLEAFPPSTVSGHTLPWWRGTHLTWISLASWAIISLSRMTVPPYGHSDIYLSLLFPACFVLLNLRQRMGGYGKKIVYECVFKSFRTESIKKYTLTSINTRWEATQRFMAAKLTRLTHKIAIQLHLVA
jgi:hypothetical protein